jgi:hypothetical protein
VGITWISWGVAPGCINIAPLGLEGSYIWLFFLSKSPICSLLEYTLVVKILKARQLRKLIALEFLYNRVFVVKKKSVCVSALNGLKTREALHKVVGLLS